MTDPNPTVAGEGSAAGPGSIDTWRPLTVSVIVPVRNGGPPFARCLESLLAASHPPDEIIVVDDGSTDGSDGVARRPGITLLRTGRCQGPAATDGSDELAERRGLHVAQTPVKLGPAAARNLGARLATGDVLLFVDADVVVQASIMHRVVQAFRAHPAAAAVIGSYDDAPTAGNFLSQYKNLLHHYVHQQGAEEGFTFWGACGAIRRSVFLAVGGFDADTYRQPCIEDIALGYTLRAAGYRIRLCKDLQVKHLKRWTAASLFRTDFFQRALPWTALILASGRMDNDLNISRSGRLKVFLTYAVLGLVLLAGAWAPALAAAVVCGALLLALDALLWRFFRHARGWRFTLGAVAWQWFYYGYSGLAFAIGLVRYLSVGSPGPLPARRPVAEGVRSR
jgi:glycosyltransferase involved in cell wall biosynthesis